MTRELRRARFRTLVALLLLGATALVLQQAGVRMRTIERLNGERIDLAAQLEIASDGLDLGRVLNEIPKIEADLERLQLIVPDDFNPAAEREEVEKEAVRFGVRALFARYRVTSDEGYRKCDANLFLIGPDAGIEALLKRLHEKARLRTWKKEKGREGCVWGTLTTYARPLPTPSMPIAVVQAEKVWLWPFTRDVERAERELRALRKDVESRRERIATVNRYELLRDELQALVDFVQARHGESGAPEVE